MESNRAAIATITACAVASVAALAIAAVMTGRWSPFTADHPQAGEVKVTEAPVPAKSGSIAARQPDGVACQGFPPPSPGAEMLVINTLNGGTYAKLAIGGEATRVVDVAVEPGDSRIYLVLESAKPVVWRFSGDHGRIERAVISAPGMLAGVTGLFDGKVCFDGPGAAGKAAESTKRQDLKTYEFQTLKGIALPGMDEVSGNSDGTVALPAGADATLWGNATAYFGNPPIRLEPVSVLAGGPKSEPDVFPSAFGLAQLVGSGSVKVMEAATTSGVETQYWIMRDITFPAAMYDAPPVKFILPREMDLPGGDPGRSCVVNEETWLPVSGSCH